MGIKSNPKGGRKEDNSDEIKSERENENENTQLTNPSIVNHNIQPPIRPHSNLDQLLDLLGLADIDSHKHRLAAGFDDALVRRAAGLVLVAAGIESRRGLQVGADDAGAFARVGQADGAADAGRGARHDGDFVLEAGGHFLGGFCGGGSLGWLGFFWFDLVWSFLDR